MDKRIGQRILNFPLTKILVGVIICAAIPAGLTIGAKSLFKTLMLNNDIADILGGMIVASAVIVCYIVLFKFYERRTITEFSGNRLAMNLVLGFALGAVLQSLTILVIYLNKGFTVISINSFVILLPSIIIAITTAVFEETIFRGILFRILEEKLGSYIALFISASIFGALHLLNQNSSLLTAFGLAVQAGLLLGAAYIYSKNLWFPIAIHFAWNFTQSGIFGAVTSRNSIGKSLLNTNIQGPKLITGGTFGPEGSIQASLFCFTAAIILIIISHRQNKIIKPF
jgi:membrane protease YdiL (CAAX protease family)